MTVQHTSSLLPHYLTSFIGVLIAVVALVYTGWRYESTEANYNVRSASFEILKELAHLQLLIDRAYYDKDKIEGNPIKGWVSVSLISDLSVLTDETVQDASKTLFSTWEAQWETLNTASSSNQALTNEIKQTRQAVLNTLKKLN